MPDHPQRYALSANEARACPRCGWLDGEHASACPWRPAPTRPRFNPPRFPAPAQPPAPMACLDCPE